MIRLQKVTKVYGKKTSVFRALSNISLTIPAGAVVAITGKSGSGKSTLMHIMSGLDRPSEGGVEVAGRNLGQMKRKEVDVFRAGSIGFIFQSFFVEPRQTCYQNISLPLEIKGVSKARRKKLIAEALSSVDMSEKVNSKAGELSGGQKQRLAIARAIVNKPEYIFADEPTGNLDTATGDRVIDLLFELNRKLGSTLCIVTHDAELAAKCKYQIGMKDGRVEKSNLADKKEAKQ